MTPLETIQSMKMPFAELKGVTFTEADKDCVIARMLVRPDLCTLHHTIHGGAVMALAVSVGGGDRSTCPRMPRAPPRSRARPIIGGAVEEPP
jgi:hypothetical protein